MTELEFWFDFASPYSYLAAETVEAAAADTGVAVIWRPFLLGPIFSEQGWSDSPFNLYPARGRYLWLDLKRETTRHGIPWQRPARFPFNSALATKTASWVEPGPALSRFCQAVFRAGFAERRDPATRAVIETCLRQAGLDHAPLERALAEGGGDRCRDDVGAARDRGIFGAPSFVVAGELYWGNERMAAALERAWAVSR